MDQIELNSVECIFIGASVYAAFKNGGYDEETGVLLKDCEEEWWQAISEDDLLSLYDNLLYKKPLRGIPMVLVNEMSRRKTNKSLPKISDDDKKRIASFLSNYPINQDPNYIRLAEEISEELKLPKRSVYLEVLKHEKEYNY
jgi:hypothetical protein